MRGWCLVALGMWVPEAFAGRVDIVSPRDGETIVDNEGKVPVTLNLSLAPGERLQLLLNGIAIELSGPESSGRVLLFNVDRGEHRLEARVVDERGGTAPGGTGPVTFTMQRPTVLLPGRIRAAPSAPPADATSTLPQEGPVGSPSASNPPQSIGAPASSSPPAGAPSPSAGTPAGAGNPGANIGRPAATGQ